MRIQKQRKGFTLIELLIVVAIIAILALIAVPNFLEAQIRAKTSRVKADMRSLATALESYYVDNNSYPPWDSWAGANGNANRRLSIPGYFWRVLTSPVSYITTAFYDGFVKLGTHSEDRPGIGDSNLLDPYIQVGVGYLGTSGGGNEDAIPKSHWCAVSYGPDQADDSGPLGRYPYTTYACPYDPTNGTVSWGDIYRFSTRAPTNFMADYNPNSGGQGAFDPWGP